MISGRGADCHCIVYLLAKLAVSIVIKLAYSIIVVLLSAQEEIYSSSYAAAAYLEAKNFPRNKKVGVYFPHLLPGLQ